MAKVTPGFKLYLYQLLRRELGCGKQTLLPQVEEVLAADDILPEDLECATIQELVEACPDFLKITVFKKGRVYATVLAHAEWDQMLAAAPEKATEKKAPAAGPKTWKKKKGGRKSFKPVKPGKQRREREAAEAQAAAERAAEEAQAAAERTAEEARQAEEARAAEEAQAAEAARAEEPLATPTPEEPAFPTPVASPARTLAEILAEARAAEPVPAPDGAPESPAVLSEEPAAAQSAASPEAAPTPGPAHAPALPAKPEPTSEPHPQPEPPAPQDEPPAAPAPKPIALTITYDPYEDMESELARQKRESEAEGAPLDCPDMLPAAASDEPTPPSGPAPAAAVPLSKLPQRLADEVACKDALLRVLYHLLPYDVEPLAVLDEDWRVARSTGSVSGSRNRVSFPLHYLHEDGSPITVTLRRTARNASGKQWSLMLVDGDDGTGAPHDAVGFEGLPAIDEGAWSDLSGRGRDAAVSPLRELAQEMVIGTWDAALGSLAASAAPERWNYPGEGVGRQSRYGILREYLTVTFHRARIQELVARSADGAFATFNTGLQTAFGDDLFACLEAQPGDIPWKLTGFATAGSGELGARLASLISPLPEAPSYLSTLESVTADQHRMVILDVEGILTGQLGRLPRAFLDELVEGNATASALLGQQGTLAADDLTALGRAIRQDGSSYRRLRRRLDEAVEQSLRALRASYRLAVPVYDPAENRTKLLVPLCLVEDARVDCALVLDLQPSGAYRAAALLSLPRAYACARVISREQPAWLTAEHVL